MSVATRLRDAMNAHDLEAFLACFDDGYVSEQPAHPGRGFSGRDQVRANWTAIFADVPDLAAELRSHASADDQEWAEWRWTGTRADGQPLDVAGVMVLGLSDGRITWGRLYMEPVEAPGGDIDAAVRSMTGRAGEA